MKNRTENYELKTTNSRLRVAIVHDWLIGGGAEQVVLELHKMFPEAPIYTSYSSDEWRAKLDGKVWTGYFQHWPFPALRKFVPYLRAWWFSHLDLSEYDLVISSSGAEAKFIKVKPGTKHVAYIHAPTHYYWSRYNEYMKYPGFGFFDPLARLGLKILVGPMRRWDYRAARRPDYMIANSSYTKDQIKKYYGRDSIVIHPPVDVDYFKLLDKSSNLRQGFVIAGRQVPYKRFDLAVAACTNLNAPLTVIGSGPDYRKLLGIAGSSVSFLGHVPRDEVRRQFQRAQAFIFPGIDDFGVVAIEAMAAGTPVIAYKAGGVLDYLITDKNGLFFEKQTVSSLASAIKNFQRGSSFNNHEIAKSADTFGPQAFQQKIKKLLADYRLT